MKKLTLPSLPLATALFCFTLLAACSDNPPPRVALDLPQGSVINLDVQNISTTDRTGVQPNDSPYNTNHFQPTIAEAVRQWTGQHLHASGSNGDAVIVIKDASLTSQPLAHGQDWFTRQQASRYVGHAEIDVEINGHGGNYALATAAATHYETLPEDPTDAEKQNAYNKVLNGLMRDLTQNLDASLHEHAQSYLGSGY